MSTMPKQPLGKLATATFAAGCFWGVEEIFRMQKGVTSTRVGYSGGSVKNPTYEEVCADATGHAEAVEVTYDPKVISYDQLLNIFWKNHNPTTPNRQGVDVGSQYRSVIFYHNAAQKKAAEKSADAYQKALTQKIVTQIVPAGPFYRAEEYHQNYNKRHGIAGCHVVL